MNTHSSQDQSQDLTGREVAVIGGGVTGLTTAYYLLRAGARVTVIEAQPQLGGLSTYFDFGPFHWDKFYHCILTSDAPLLQLIKDLGLSPELHWTETKVGFFTEGKLHSMSTSADFLRFRPLSLWAKFRLGLGVLYASRIREGKPLEAFPVSDWLQKVFGRENYEKMWGPLLKCKLGSCREEASAAFIWATIFRLYSTRDKRAGHKERLGYVGGGYHSVLTRLVEQIEAMGGRILLGTPIARLEASQQGGIDVVTGSTIRHFDLAVSTVPSHVLTALAPSLDADFVHKLQAVKYLGMVCVALLLKRKVSPYYVTNLTDEDLPFTGIIEMTNLISLEETGGRHLLYLPKYTPPGDPLFEASDEEVWKMFWSHFQRVHPQVSELDVEAHFVFRERLVQPVPVIHYSDIVPQMQTSMDPLLLANTTQIVNSTLNNNEMVKIARRAVEVAMGRLTATKDVRSDRNRSELQLVANSASDDSTAKALSSGRLGPAAFSRDHGVAQDGRARKTAVTALTYHAISSDPDPDAYTVSPAQLREHLALVTRLHGAADSQLQTTAITFDDGHISNYIYAVPLMQEHAIQAKFFVNVGQIGVRSDFMTWAQLRELVSLGYEVQSHGWSHQYLTRCSEGELHSEVYRSKQILEERLGVAVTAIAAPGGRWNDRVLKACQAAQYRELYTSHPWGNCGKVPGLAVRGRFTMRRTLDAQQLEALLTGQGLYPLFYRAKFSAKEAGRHALGDSAYHWIWAQLFRKPARGA